MKPLGLFGIALITLGVVGLLVANVSFTEHKTVLDAGPLKITKDQEKTFPIPSIAGIVAIVAGFGLVVVGSRRA